jgi:translation initiation factor 3 subunit H
VNVDNNTVGWYHSTYLGSHITEELISTQYNYQESIPKCVCLIFDPMKTAQGNLALKAVRLTDSFLALYKGGEFTLDRCAFALILQNPLTFVCVWQHSEGWSVCGGYL